MSTALLFCWLALLSKAQANPEVSTAATAVQLLSYFRKNADNVLVSPLSISTCFSLILPGARGDTENQISMALSYPTTGRDDIYRAFNGRRVAYNAMHPVGGVGASGSGLPPPILQIANSIWVDRSLALESAYRQLVDDLLRVVDFDDSSSSTALNAWVANHTNNKIKSVVSAPGVLPGKMIAVNAVYFKASWSKQFQAPMTALGSFYTSVDRLTVAKFDSHFMHQVDYFQYKQTPSHQVIALPYAGTSIEMVLALPRKTGVEFAAADLTDAMIGMARTRLALALPKFEFKTNYELNDVLKSMGMQAPFSDSDADFSGLSSSKSLFIHKVLHKTFIAVDEFGTEAAAVTAIIMKVTSVGRPDPPPLLCKVDHPFDFFLRDRANGTVLFAGHVGMPLPPAGSAVPASRSDESIWESKFNTKVITSVSPGPSSSDAKYTKWSWLGPWVLLLQLGFWNRQ